MKTPGGLDDYGNPTSNTTRTIRARVEHRTERTARYSIGVANEFGEEAQSSTQVLTLDEVTLADTLTIDDRDRKVLNVEKSSAGSQPLYRVLL